MKFMKKFIFSTIIIASIALFVILVKHIGTYRMENAQTSVKHSYDDYENIKSPKEVYTLNDFNFVVINQTTLTEFYSNIYVPTVLSRSYGALLQFPAENGDYIYFKLSYSEEVNDLVTFDMYIGNENYLPNATID